MHYDAAHSVSLHVIATDPAAVSAMRAPAKRGTEAAEGQAEIGPGPAAPASPMRFSGERAVQVRRGLGRVSGLSAVLAVQPLAQASVRLPGTSFAVRLAAAEPGGTMRLLGR
jgi:hypothetical protein